MATVIFINPFNGQSVEFNGTHDQIMSNIDRFYSECRDSARSCTNNHKVQYAFEKILKKRKTKFYWGCLQAAECLTILDSKYPEGSKINYKDVENVIDTFEKNYNKR